MECDSTEFIKFLLRDDVSTVLSSEIKKYIWLRIPVNEDVEPPNFLLLATAS